MKEVRGLGRRRSREFEDFVRARPAALFGTATLLTGQNRSEAEDLLQGALERVPRLAGTGASRAGRPERMTFPVGSVRCGRD